MMIMDDPSLVCLFFIIKSPQHTNTYIKNLKKTADSLFQAYKQNTPALPWGPVTLFVMFRFFVNEKSERNTNNKHETY